MGGLLESPHACHLVGLVRLHLSIRHCPHKDCSRYPQPYRLEAVGALALPHHEFGLDVIALEWFEPWQTAALLESARTYRPIPPARPLPSYCHALVAFIALTGCRMREAFGIEVEDVDFTRRVIRIHPNSWRRLKTPRSTRVVPLWPQLTEILSDYIGTYGARLNRLRFPSERLLARGKEGMITDSNTMLDRLGSRVSFQLGEVRWNKLRHGYATA